MTTVHILLALLFGWREVASAGSHPAALYRCMELCGVEDLLPAAEVEAEPSSGCERRAA